METRRFTVFAAWQQRPSEASAQRVRPNIPLYSNSNCVCRVCSAVLAAFFRVAVFKRCCVSCLWAFVFDKCVLLPFFHSFYLSFECTSPSLSLMRRHYTGCTRRPKKLRWNKYANEWITLLLKRFSWTLCCVVQLLWARQMYADFSTQFRFLLMTVAFKQTNWYV